MAGRCQPIVCQEKMCGLIAYISTCAELAEQCSNITLLKFVAIFLFRFTRSLFCRNSETIFVLHFFFRYLILKVSHYYALHKCYLFFSEGFNDDLFFIFFYGLLHHHFYERTYILEYTKRENFLISQLEHCRHREVISSLLQKSISLFPF